MTAIEIIDEIRQLPPDQRVQVVQCVRSIECGALTGEALARLAEEMVEENGPAEAEKTRERIVAGFYGERSGAAGSTQ